MGHHEGSEHTDFLYLKPDPNPDWLTLKDPEKQKTMQLGVDLDFNVKAQFRVRGFGYSQYWSAYTPISDVLQTESKLVSITGLNIIGVKSHKATARLTPSIPATVTAPDSACTSDS